MQETIALWEIDEIKNQIQGENGILRITIGAFVVVFSGFAIFPKFQLMGILIIIMSFFPTIFIFKRLTDIQSIRKAMLIIAVDDGHPWHPADEGESTNTRLKNDIGEWIPLPHSAEISLHENIVTGGWTVRDEEEKVLLNLGLGINHSDAINVENYINQALILSRAQEFEQDPTLRDARIRENSAEGILDREWLDTSPGQVEIEFGQMGRAREILGKTRNNVHSSSDSEE
mgnify:CR=1 FL=1